MVLEGLLGMLQQWLVLVSSTRSQSTVLRARLLVPVSNNDLYQCQLGSLTRYRYLPGVQVA